MNLEFTVYGEPTAKARPRVTRSGVAYTPKKTVEYENLVKLEYQRQCKGAFFDRYVPIDIRIIAYFGIPSNASKKKRQEMLDGYIRPCKKPDADNVLKSIADSLNGVAYHDDSQIVDCQVRKFYSDRPRVVVKIKDSWR